MNKQALLKELNSEKMFLDNDKTKNSDKKIIINKKNENKKKIIINKKNENKKKILSIIIVFMLAPFAINFAVFLADKTYEKMEKNWKKQQEIKIITKDLERISMTAQEMVMKQLKPINMEELETKRKKYE